MTVLLLPEIFVALTALGVIIGEVGFKEHREKFTFAFSLGGLFLALVSAVMLLSHEPAEIFSKTLLVDPVSQFFKAAFIFAAMISAVFSRISKDISSSNRTEFLSLVILATLASCIVVSAVHFLTLYAALEAVSLICYALVAFSTCSRASAESAIKNLIFGAVTSLFFVFGIVLLFGFTQTFNILDISTVLSTGPAPASFLWAVFALLFIGIASRLALFPFQLLGPTVIEGAPTPVSAFLSVTPLLVGISLAIRICFHIFSARPEGGAQWIPVTGIDWPEVLSIIAAITMTIANLSAINQKSLKRLLAYSTIGNVAYLLLGFVVVNQTGLAAILFGSSVLILATLGAFLVAMMCMDEAGSEDHAVLVGLVWRRPFEAVAFCAFLLSLAALPPFAGFVSRVYLIGAVVHEKMYWLAAITGLNLVIGLTMYFGLMRLVFQEKEQLGSESSATPAREHAPRALISARVALAILLVPTFALGIYWDPLLRYISNSLMHILW